MNKDLLSKMLNDKLEAKLAEEKLALSKKALQEAEDANLNEDHFSEDDIEKILAKFEKSMNHSGIKAVEDYISAEADGNKGKAASAAGKIKRALKEV